MIEDVGFNMEPDTSTAHLIRTSFSDQKRFQWNFFHSQEWSERLAAKPAGGQTRSTCWDGDLANEGYHSFNMKTNGWHGETGDFQLRELIFNSTLKSSFPRDSKEIEHTWAQKQYDVDLHLESLCDQKTQPQSEVIAGDGWRWYPHYHCLDHLQGLSYPQKIG